MYTRLLEATLKKKFFGGKAIVLLGARQTGKTTLAQTLIRQIASPQNIRHFNCDNPTDRDLLENRDLEFLQQLIGNASIIFIDEGQKVTTIGQTVKLLVDHYQKKKQVLVTGSSSFHLLDRTSEALTGRKYLYTLFPLSVEEIYSPGNTLRFYKEINQLLVFGSYPEVLTRKTFSEKIELLNELYVSSLYKDILEFQQLKNPALLVNLLKALAFQIGSEVSLSELSNLLGIDKKTVERYIDLLEKSFIIFRLSPYTRNKRREISKSKKIYFYDLGIRNALIKNFNFIEDRNDGGALFENFAMVERLKYREYHQHYAQPYFWRTYDGVEIDLVEEGGGELKGYEFKWNPKKKTRPPEKWLEYENSSYKIITPRVLKGFIW